MASKPQNCLRRLRAERGLTVEQVAEASGVSDRTLQVIENQGRDATVNIALKLPRF